MDASGPTPPGHYSQYGIEPVDFILRNHLPFCEGNIIKYVCRWRQKNGREDLLKARSYLDLLLQHHEDSPDDHS